MNKILVIGCGLISGSLIKNLINIYDIEVVEINEETKYLLENKYNIKTYNSISQIDFESDYEFVIMGLYPLLNKKTILDNLNFFNYKNIFDVAGLQNIYDDCIDLFKENNINYIATHPMCGREYNGFNYSLKELFINKNIIITPLINNNTKFYNKVISIYKNTEANIIEFKNPKLHDEIVTLTSQLPHVISTAYTNLIDLSIHEEIKLISSNSFNEFSRISNINEKLWTEIFIDNSDNLSNLISSLIDNIIEINGYIMNKDKKNIDSFLISARNTINSVNKKQ